MQQFGNLPLRGPQKYSVKDARLWQDPLMEVRKAFGAKVRRTVLLLNARPSYAQRASKYAAMLPMAGMDPSETNRWLSDTVLISDITTFRVAVKTARIMDRATQATMLQACTRLLQLAAFPLLHRRMCCKHQDAMVQNDCCSHLFVAR